MGIAERKERERLQRRLDIINAAETVFFSKGLEAARMDDVAEKAELSKGTLYLYFKTKEQLYAELIHRGMGIMISYFEKAYESEDKGIDKLEAIGRAYYAFFMDYPDYFKAIMYYEQKYVNEISQDPVLETCAEDFECTHDVVVRALNAGIQDGSIRSDVDPVMMAVSLWAQAMGVFQLAHYKGEGIRLVHGVETADFIQYFFDFVRDALSP